MSRNRIQYVQGAARRSGLTFGCPGNGIRVKETKR